MNHHEKHIALLFVAALLLITTACNGGTQKPEVDEALLEDVWTDVSIIGFCDDYFGTWISEDQKYIIFMNTPNPDDSWFVQGRWDEQNAESQRFATILSVRQRESDSLYEVKSRLYEYDENYEPSSETELLCTVLAAEGTLSVSIDGGETEDYVYDEERQIPFGFEGDDDMGIFPSDDGLSWDYVEVWTAVEAFFGTWTNSDENQLIFVSFATDDGVDAMLLQVHNGEMIDGSIVAVSRSDDMWRLLVNIPETPFPEVETPYMITLTLRPGSHEREILVTIDELGERSYEWQEDNQMPFGFE